MAYITLAQAKQYLGTDVYESAYDDVTNPGTPSDTVLQNDIDAITAVVDSYVMQAYSAVITGAQSLNILKSLSEQLLIAKAYERYSMSEVPEWVAGRYDTAIFRLKDIQSGKMLLSDETQESRSSVFKYAYQSPNADGTGRQVFNRDTMSGY
jgi:phage gp36-like protein